MTLKISNRSSPDNVGHDIAVAAASAARRDFLADDEQTISGDRFLDMAAARAAQITALRGDKAPVVAISCGRGIVTWADAVGVWLAGGTVVLLGISLPEEHVAGILEIAAPDWIVGAHPKYPALTASYRLLDNPDVSTADDICFPEPMAAAAVVFTSGSTNRPKGALLSHQALRGNANATGKRLGLGARDRLFFAIPFNFISAISHFIVTLQSGAILYCVETRLMFKDFIDGLVASGANAIGGSPLQLRWIAEAGIEQTIDWAMSSGDHLAVETINRLLLRHPSLRLFTVYGMTELAGRFCILPPQSHGSDAGSVGWPIEGLTATVRRENGDECAHDESGEIYVTGDYLMDGYLNNSSATDEVIGVHGLRTGDLGVKRPNGVLVIEGRADDVFKCNGEKVSAQEITGVMMQTGKFADMAVVAWDDSTYGTVPVACYQLNSGSVFVRGEIVRLLRTKLPPSHIPRKFLELPALPRTGSGKLRRRELKAIICDRLDAADRPQPSKGTT